MKCPNCQINFVEIESQGVVIDYCPRCRGKWLTYGKLDKIREKSYFGYTPEKAAIIKIENPFQGDNYDSSGHHGHDGRYSGHKRRVKRIDLLGDKFDF